MSGAPKDIAYVRREDAPILPPPAVEAGVSGWLWRNLIRSFSNYSTPAAAAQSAAMLLATLGVAYFSYVQLRDFLQFVLFDAVWVADDGMKREACATEAQGGRMPDGWFGACYPFISARWKQMIYYDFPVAEIWRVNIVFLLGALGVARLTAEAVSNRSFVGVILLALAAAYGLLVTEMFGEPFGVRVGVQILAGVGLLFLWLRFEPGEKGLNVRPVIDRAIRYGAAAALIGLAVFASVEASGAERTTLQALVLRAPLAAMAALFLFARARWIAAAMLTAFPLYAFVLLTGADLEIGAATLWVWAGVGGALIALGWFGRHGFLTEIGEAFGGLALTLGLAAAAVLAVALVVSGDYGLETVETYRWGGLLVTLVVAMVGIVFSLPLGVLLALGRRSTLPAVRFLSIVFIEFWRGVPLVTVLFMSSVMLPLFVPQGMEVDKLVRALIGVTLFAAAYQAEVVRGGLQAIPRGQYEGAQALGLGYWRMMALVVLPQALTLVIPGIVNTFIGLFKDTSLVLIISLFDLLGVVEAAIKAPEWKSPVLAPTGFLVAAVIFWIFCFAMSRYSLFMERKLRKGLAR